MKFSTRLDSNLSAEKVFDRVSDFTRLERIMVRRGASVKRLSPAEVPGAGMAWDIGFSWRGRERTLRLEVTRFDRPVRISLAGGASSFQLTSNLSVIALSKSRSRLMVECDLRPKTMKARLLIQTAKLSKGLLDKRYARAVDQIFEEILA